MTHTLVSLREMAYDLGVNVSLEDCGDAVLIGDFARTIGPPGSGAKVMKAICEYADQEEIELILGAHKSLPRLVEYYEGFGFEMDHMQGGIHASMIRFPV